MVKLGEYAQAGIAHYWIADLDGPSLRASRLVGSHYEAGPAAVGSFECDEPFAARLDLRPR
ncbi:MAG: hypothetical protein ACT4QG_20780 [Sporichthyaceae bacterium]